MLRFLISALALASLVPAAVYGQAHSRTYVTIPDAFPPIDARAMVVREPGVDLIVLRPGEADADVLSMALNVLRDARERVPTPSTGIIIPITGFAVTNRASEEVTEHLERTLRRLSQAEAVELGSLGTGRRVRLPGN